MTPAISHIPSEVQVSVFHGVKRHVPGSRESTGRGDNPHLRILSPIPPISLPGRSQYPVASPFL